MAIYSKPLTQNFHIHLFLCVSCIKMSFSCHVQKFSLHDVIVSVMFWQPVPVHTPKAKNRLFEQFQNHVPGGLSDATTGKSMDLTVSITWIPKRNEMKMKCIVLAEGPYGMCEIGCSHHMPNTYMIDYCKVWRIWCQLDEGLWTKITAMELFLTHNLTRLWLDYKAFVKLLLLI